MSSRHHDDRKRSREESSSSYDYDYRPSRSHRSERDHYHRDPGAGRRSHAHHDMMGEDFTVKLFLKNIDPEMTEREVMDYLNTQMKRRGLVHYKGKPVIDCEKRGKARVASIVVRDKQEASRLRELSEDRKLSLDLRKKPLVIQPYGDPASRMSSPSKGSRSQRQESSSGKSRAGASPAAAKQTNPKLEKESPDKQPENNNNISPKKSASSKSPSPTRSSSPPRVPQQSELKRRESDSTGASNHPLQEDEQAQDPLQEGVCARATDAASVSASSESLDDTQSTTPMEGKDFSKVEDKFIISEDTCIQLLQEKLAEETEKRNAVEKQLAALAQEMMDARIPNRKADQALVDALDAHSKERAKRRKLEESLHEANQKYSDLEEKVIAGKASYEDRIANLEQQVKEKSANFIKMAKKWKEEKEELQAKLDSKGIIVLDDRAEI
jgi:hypothetical protein